MEILAPAGSMDQLEAAIRSGADAVYFGVAELNARRNAKNFKTEQLSEICSYCHIRGIKAYLTLNTLISDEEIPLALNIVKESCKSGIDAILVQDLGIAKLISECAPKMHLHASTQMSIHDVNGVKLLKNYGFKRVVLARECSKTDIQEITEFANNNNIEIEIFVQGAHCMSFSGQCLLSAFLGSRSGNRGLCAQPCRLPFSVGNSNGFDLSLKDMNLYNYVEDFREMKIASLKIEGRMKRPEYVAIAVSALKSALENNDNYKEKTNLLENIFSRSGFTDGYYCNKINIDMFGIRSEQDIDKSKQFLNTAHDLYRRERQSVNINLIFSLNSENAILKADDGENAVEICEKFSQEVTSKPLSNDFVVSKLSKTGSTPYKVENVSVNVDTKYTIASSDLNSMKNKILDNLTQERAKPKSISFTNLYKKREKTINETITEKYISVHTLEQLPDDPSCAELFIVPFSSNLDKVADLIKNGYEIAIKTPTLLFDIDITSKLKSFYDVGVEFAVAENLGAVLPIKKARLNVIAGTGLNIFNSASTEFFDFSSAILSYELYETQIKNISSNIPVGLVVYGKTPLMTLRNCPNKSINGCNNCNKKITDRMDISFPLFCEDSTTRLYNNRPIYLGDKKNMQNITDFIVFSFTDESKSDVEKILDNYKYNKIYNNEFTRGLYFKGVL